MAGLRELKNRIKSTGNIKQMTKAMEAVSAVKMRRSVALALESRPYALTALRVLEKMRRHLEPHETLHSPLFDKNGVSKKTLVVIASDKGLVGSFNTTVLRKAANTAKEPGECEFVAIGKRAADNLKRRGNLVASFTGAGDFGAVAESLPISKFLMKRFLDKATGAVDLIYSNFISALQQEVIVRPLLPLSIEGLETAVAAIVPKRGRYANIPTPFEQMAESEEAPFLFEPSPESVLREISEKLLAVEIHSAILEANASEHSSRMIAMKSASENASDLIGELSMQYNKSRQAAITKELSEITAGKEAVGN